MSKYPLDKPVRVLSLGAGVQSSALLFAYLNGDLGPMPDFAVFADTQAEPDEVYKWLKVIRWASAEKLPVIVASAGNIIEDSKRTDKRFASIPFFIKNPDGSQGMGRRQCTNEYKIVVVQKAVRTELGYLPRKRMKHQVEMIIGISIDEAQRMRDSRTKWITNKYPLIDELGWDRGDCKTYVRQQSLGDAPKSACYICPYRSNESWKHLKKKDPESFAKAVAYEKYIQKTKDDDKVSGRWTEGTPYLHRSMIPLDEVDFDVLAPDSPLFGNDCEGMCGV